MIRWRNSCFLAITLLGFAACRSDGLTRPEKQEFEAIDRALASYASSPLEDRPIRLQELEDIGVNTPRMTILKAACLDARKALLQSEQLIQKIKVDTRELETSITSMKDHQVAGTDADGGLLEKIAGLSRTANATKLELDKAMAEAERLLASCQKNRIATRALVIENP